MTSSLSEGDTSAADRRERRLQRSIDRVTHHLWSSPVRTFRELIEHQRGAVERGRTVVRAFYLISVMWVVYDMMGWYRHLDAEAVEPLWTAFWFDWFDHGTSVRVILYGYLALTILAAALPHRRLARLGFLVGYSAYLGLVNGYGKAYGHYTGWWYVALFFVLIPDQGFRGRGSATTRHRFLTGIWTAQLGLLVMYSLSGAWKVLFAAYDLVSGDRLSTLHPDGFSMILADRILETNERTLLGDTLLDLPWLGWALYLGTVYLETASLLIAFRPRLHRIWGFGLLLFHVGTQLLMNFTFLPNIALLGLLFVGSPSAPDEFDPRATFLDLPGVRLVHRTLGRLRSRPPATT